MKYAAAISAAIVLFAAPALADGDAAKGENVFKKCRACHEIGEGAKVKVGPVLNGVIGRTAGTSEGFTKYSDAMKEAGAGGLVWNEETLAQYLADPKQFVPKNKMAFAGLKKEDDIADVIAYLKQFPQ
ncbi:MAG: cytochrome c family protein [Rhodobiaceae bacterium]|nr:cytochrome c family protein [Rhodobiaceae bacterium]